MVFASIGRECRRGKNAVFYEKMRESRERFWELKGGGEEREREREREREHVPTRGFPQFSFSFTQAHPQDISLSVGLPTQK